MKYHAIFMNVALSIATFTGVTLSHQESAQAQTNSGGCNNIGTNNNGGTRNASNCPTAVPTPALLPGLIGLGGSLLYKRKAKAKI